MVSGWVSRGLGGRNGVAFSPRWTLVQIDQHNPLSSQELECWGLERGAAHVVPPAR